MNPTKTRRQSLSQTLINLHSDPNRSGESVDWLSLPNDLLLDVLSRLDSLEDFSAFRAVCRSLPGPFPALSAHPPLLLSCFSSSESFESFYDLLRRRLYKIRLRWSPPSRCSLAFSHGYLITVSYASASASGPSKLLLWNLLSGARIRLRKSLRVPKSLRNPKFSRLLPRVILSSSPASSVCSVVCFHPSSKCLQFCSLGDRLWKLCTYSNYQTIQDMIFFSGCLYALTNGRRLATVDLVPPLAQLTFLGSTITPNSDVLGNDGKWMLAESEGNLLLVGMFLYEEFSVFRWEFEGGGGWRKLSDLGGRALFLGDNGFAASMLPTCSAVKGNCIYFASLGSYYLVFDLHHQRPSVIPLDLSSLLPQHQRPLVPKIWVFPSLCRS